MTARLTLGIALALAGCYAGPEPPPDFAQAPDFLVEAMKQERTIGEVLPTVSPRPRLVAEAVARSGQDMALYEYQPVPQPDPSEVYVSLTFANDTLVSVGSRGRTPSGSWFGRLLDSVFPDHSFEDPYGPERVADCVEALEESAYIHTASYSSSSGRSC